MPDLSAMLESAVLHHQSGCLERADMMYRQVLQAQPENPVALHSLGVLAHQRGRRDGQAYLASAALRPRLAMDAGANRQPVVSDNAPVPAKAMGRLDFCLP